MGNCDCSECVEGKGQAERAMRDSWGDPGGSDMVYAQSFTRLSLKNGALYYILLPKK